VAKAKAITGAWHGATWIGNIFGLARGAFGCAGEAQAARLQKVEVRLPAGHYTHFDPLPSVYFHGCVTECCIVRDRTR
jgi:hypothetical protein